MKMLQKFSAMLTAGALTLSALPLTALAADIVDPSTGEAIAMNATVTLSGDSATVTGENVTVEGTTITVTASGSYEFSGKLNDGQIIVNVADEVADPGTVKLYFNGVDITGQNAAAVYVVNAENTSINLVENTANYLADANFYNDAEGTTAVIFAKDDLTIKGEGSLRVDALYNYGLQCNNDVKITGGNIKFKVTGTPSDSTATATTREDAVRSKTSVEIKGGTIDINAEGDGVKSTKGDVFISGGVTEIKAGNDAVQGETSLQISGGSLKANGDRGLTCSAGSVTISGGTVCATATDNQVTGLTATQPTALFNMAAEVAKDNQIALLGADGAALLTVTPDKKFTYLLLSDPQLALGTAYTLTFAGYTATAGDASTFTLTDTATVFDAVSANVPIIDPNDVNGDGKVTVSDAVMLARIIAEDNTVELKGGEIDRADINGSGMIDSDDLTTLLKLIAGLS